MRDVNEVRFRLGGDQGLYQQEQGKFYIGVGRTQLGILKNLMSFGRLQQLTRTITLGDGTGITVQSFPGQDTIIINPPYMGGVAKPAMQDIYETIIGENVIIVGQSGSYPVMWTNGSIKQLEIPSGYSSGLAIAISTDGSTIVGAIDGHPAIWNRKSGSVVVNTLPMPLSPNGYPNTTGLIYCTSENGSVAGGYTPYTGNYKSGFLEEKSTGIFSGLPFHAPSNGYDNLALGCSGDGTIFVGYGNVVSSIQYAGGVFPLVWAQDPITKAYSANYLALPSGYTNGLANNISQDGRVVVGSVWYVSSSHVVGDSYLCIWIDGVPYDLGLGYQVVDCSQDGNILVAETANGHSALITKDSSGNYTVFNDLGNPPPGYSLSVYKMSAKGDIVVGGTGVSAFMWSGGKVQMLPPLQTGWIANAYGITELDEYNDPDDPDLPSTTSLVGTVPVLP